MPGDTIEFAVELEHDFNIAEAEVVRSMPGMGVVFTAELLAEVGDASRFVSADWLAAAAGIVSVSGTSEKVSYQRRGNRVLKRILLQIGFQRGLLPRTQPGVLPAKAFEG